MRPGAWLPLLLASCTSSAWADAAPPGCDTLLAAAAEIGVTAESAMPIGGTGCVAERVHIAPMGRYGFTIERLVATRLDFAGLAGSHIPSRIRLEAHGVRIAASPPWPLYRYISALVAKPFDATLDYEADADGRVLHLSELAMHARSGDLMVSGEIVGFDPTTLDDREARPSPNAGLRWLNLRMDSQGLLESFVLLPMATALLGDEADPEARVASLKALATASLRAGLAQTATPPASVDALARFIDDLPHPTKVLEVTIDLPHPITLADMDALQSGQRTLRKMLADAVIAAHYDPP